MDRRMGHLDADCFYVSCERVRHPFLRGQSVGVLSNQGACVIAKSYEMKARGVTTGMPIWDALPLCPEGIFVKRDFEWYEVLSRQMLDLVRRFSPTVEYYSIDEVFFDAQAMSFGDRLAIYPWGNRDDAASRLPRTGWCRLESLEAGHWGRLRPEPVDIPASLGLEKGVWFQIAEGIRGILVEDERGLPHVYMLTQPASHYYQVMTRHDRMPVLLGQQM